ncbi:FAD synthase [Mycoplasmopsis glycophila]|uniref:FAD synthase n=1 Tax=Mycoplasmopsis glycophila TaxID=171285 RepID=A0A449AUT5_9BACT|nr:hypothetical protein [Mycoplasmopsis glycophila]VEU70271.1 riboflavin kinase [Mycoplasmopsis glycophila]
MSKKDKVIIYQFDEFVPKQNDNFMIGAFESFHIGHQTIYNEMLKKKSNGRKVLITFNNDDLPISKSQAFTDRTAKYWSLAQLEFDCIVELNFSKIGLMQPEQFLQKLTNNLPVNIFVGEDFKFGKGASATSHDIAKFLPLANVYIIQLLKQTGIKISTSLLKEKLLFGEIEDLNKYLVNNYTISFKISNIDPNTVMRDNLKYTQIHPGIYCGIFYDQKYAFYGLLHINTKQKWEYILVDNEEYEPSKNQFLYFEFDSEIRLIKSHLDDEIKSIDIEKTREKFTF